MQAIANRLDGDGGEIGSAENLVDDRDELRAGSPVSFANRRKRDEWIHTWAFASSVTVFERESRVSNCNQFGIRHIFLSFLFFSEQEEQEQYTCGRSHLSRACDVGLDTREVSGIKDGASPGAVEWWAWTGLGGGGGGGSGRWEGEGGRGRGGGDRRGEEEGKIGGGSEMRGGDRDGGGLVWLLVGRSGQRVAGGKKEGVRAATGLTGRVAVITILTVWPAGSAASGLWLRRRRWLFVRRVVGPDKIRSAQIRYDQIDSDKIG